MGAVPTVTVRRSGSDILLGANLRSARAWSIFATRLALGFLFLWGGIEKIETWGGLVWNGDANTSATTGYLKFAVSGPFAEFFHSLAGNPAVEFLVVYGELLIGISIMFGILTRVGGVSGVAMALLFYLSQLPVQHNPFVNEYVVYMLVFLAFVFLTPGRFLGLDGLLQSSRFVESRPTLKRVLTTLG